MSTTLDQQKLALVFQTRPDILQGIKKAADSPTRIKLFNDIASFFQDQADQSQSPEPSAKRRRIEEAHGRPAATNGSHSHSSGEVATESILLEIKEISVSIPQRKKYDLCFTNQHVYARLPNTEGPVPGIIYPWKDIEFAFYLPVPEKNLVQHNYVLFPRGSCMSSLATPSATADTDPLVFTVSAGTPKPGTISGPYASAATSVSDSYQTLFDWTLNKCFKAASSNVEITTSDPSQFHSAQKQPQRPKEKAVHVKAFRGSKDGYLFFLPNGILWGFKKPLLFIPMERISSMSFTSVLQRTFNIAVEVITKEGDDEDTIQEIEFAMLDQEDYDGIHANYVMRHGLQDRSMADKRKGKLELAENAKAGKKGQAEAELNGTAGEGGLSELRKAEQLLQDAEDEDEEDYDPGSGADSEGSGSSSEEHDDEEDDADGDDDGLEG